MKLERIESGSKCELWEFFKHHLPSSLRATKFGDGYGTVHGIDVKEKTDILGYLPLTHGIAEVRGNTVELRHPEWFSDFEDIIIKYEELTGKEVLFKLWES